MRGEFKLVPSEEGVWKYVRVAGQYRFVPSDFHSSHCDCVLDGETAESAGTININDRGWAIYGRYSMTLKVCTDDADTEGLTKLLDKPMYERY